MAIQINGNGTITGISVGGLPDGIVDTDMIASNAVTPAKSTISGGVVQTQQLQLSSPSIISSTNTTWVDTGLTDTITPTSASNKILVIVIINTFIDSVPQYGSSGQHRITRDNGSATTELTTFRYSSWDDVATDLSTMMYWDTTHNSTSQLTYNTQFRLESYYQGSASVSVHRSGSPNIPNISLIEFAV